MSNTGLNWPLRFFSQVSVAVEAHKRAQLPFVAVLSDPTYGGVSASYAMQVCIVHSPPPYVPPLDQNTHRGSRLSTPVQRC